MRILVCCAAGYTNIGDDAILDGLCGLLRRDVPDAEITVACGTHSDFRKRLKVHQVDLDSSNDLIAVIAGCDLMIYGGGGLFYDTGYVPSPDMISTPFRPHWLFMGLRLALYAKMLGVPFHLCGVGVGPINTQLGGRVLAMTAELADTISLRSPGSLAELRRSSVEEHALLSYCPALTLEYVSRSDHAVRESCIAISIRPCSYSFLVRIAALVDRIVEEFGQRVVFLTHQSIRDDDLSAIRQVRRMIRNGGKTEIFTPANPQASMDFMSSVSALLTMRLHSAMLATNVGTPWVGIAGHPKVAYFAEQLGWQFGCVLAGEEDKDAVDAVRAILDDLKHWGLEVASRRAALLQSTPSPLDLFVKAMENSESLPKRLGDREIANMLASNERTRQELEKSRRIANRLLHKIRVILHLNH